MFKVVVSDLDGTLLNGQHQISSRTRDTLHRLVDQGVKFVVATGRHHVDVRSIRDALGLDIYLITSNGAVVHDKQDSLVFNQALPSTVAAELIGEIKAGRPGDGLALAVEEVGAPTILATFTVIFGTPEI